MIGSRPVPWWCFSIRQSYQYSRLPPISVLVGDVRRVQSAPPISGPFDVAKRPDLNIIPHLDARAEHDVGTHDHISAQNRIVQK